MNQSDIISGKINIFSNNMTEDKNSEISETYSMYYGRCFTVITKSKVNYFTQFAFKIHKAKELFLCYTVCCLSLTQNENRICIKRPVN